MSRQQLVDRILVRLVQLIKEHEGDKHEISMIEWACIRTNELRSDSIYENARRALDVLLWDRKNG